MQEDGGSLKFVALFRTTADHAEINEPSQIAELQYWGKREIVTALLDSPDEFTPTFQQLYERFGE